MFKRLTAAERQRKRIEEYELRRRNLAQTETPLCAKHGWAPQMPAGKLPPPASECPGCKREAERNRPTEYETVKIDVGKLGETPRLERAWDNHLVRPLVT